jgi:hypothetical protein
MNDSTQRVDIVDLNAGKLPYSDGRFCLVTCVETIEHLEQTRSLLREIIALEPGGLAVITTPNILNLRSRLRCLRPVFNLFGPLPIGDRRVYNPGDTSIRSTIFILAMLCAKRASSISASVDLPAPLLLPFVILFLPMKVARLFLATRKNKFRTITPENRDWSPL